VPVPRQQLGSNDCGLFACHFLRVFLEDIEESVEFCTKVRGTSLSWEVLTGYAGGAKTSC
jgi:hypothetical protein